MDCETYEVHFPKNACELDQNEEWIKVVTNNGSKKLRLHDYSDFFDIQGLYEEVMCDKLKCNSPNVVCSLLEKEMVKSDDEIDKLRALDFGAGNGMVGECFSEKFDCEAMVGLDIIPEAKTAAYRDRPEVYDEYYVMDLSTIKENDQKTLEKWNFNTLLTVAALGYGDIPTKAFINAFNVIEEGGWIAFNIKDRFMSEKDDSGYRCALDAMMGDSLDLLQTVQYRHRLSLAGDPLHYYAVIGRKLKDIESC